MDALQKPGRIAGLWFIGTFVFSIPAVFLYDPVLNDTNYIFGGGLDALDFSGRVVGDLLWQSPTLLPPSSSFRS